MVHVCIRPIVDSVVSFVVFLYACTDAASVFHELDVSHARTGRSFKQECSSQSSCIFRVCYSCEIYIVPSWRPRKHERQYVRRPSLVDILTTGWRYDVHLVYFFLHPEKKVGCFQEIITSLHRKYSQNFVKHANELGTWEGRTDWSGLMEPAYTSSFHFLRTSLSRVEVMVFLQFH